LLLSFVLTGFAACSPLGGEEEEITEHYVDVVRDNLTVVVNGSGNIELTEEMDLTFGIAGRIEEILIREGDAVGKGDLLARLDTDDLELAVTQAQVSITTAEVAVTQGEVTLETAKYNLTQTRELYYWTEITAAEGEVADAEDFLESALSKLNQTASGCEGEEEWKKIVFYAEKRLDTAQARLDAMLSGTDSEEVAIQQLQIEAAEESLELNRESLDLARQSLEQAKKQLVKATVIAPYSGVVTSVSADEQDTVTTATPIFHLIDPTSLQLNVQVDEIDVTDVKVGQKAIMEVDALLGRQIEAEVTSIGLLPTAEAGVIVYDVEIDFDIAEDSRIKSGMSAAADIVIAEREDVLLVPDRAIKQDSDGNDVVDVVVGDQVEERIVVVGLSDGFFTEIINGLEEGEVVIERRSAPKQAAPGFF